MVVIFKTAAHVPHKSHKHVSLTKSPNERKGPGDENIAIKPESTDKFCQHKQELIKSCISLHKKKTSKRYFSRGFPRHKNTTNPHKFS